MLESWSCKHTVMDKEDPTKNNQEVTWLTRSHHKCHVFILRLSHVIVVPASHYIVFHIPNPSLWNICNSGQDCGNNLINYTEFAHCLCVTITSITQIQCIVYCLDDAVYAQWCIDEVNIFSKQNKMSFINILTIKFLQAIFCHVTVTWRTSTRGSTYL